MPAAFPLNTAVLYFSSRLHQALEGIFSRPLTLIEAPMGYGKTVAARDVLGKREIRLVWTSVLGNSEDAFWRDFCRALRRSFPQAQDTLESLLRLGSSRDAVRLAAAPQKTHSRFSPPHTGEHRLCVFNHTVRYPSWISSTAVTLLSSVVISSHLSRCCI